MIPDLDAPSNVVLVQNRTGGALDRFSVLGINGPVITPAANLLEFQNRFPLAGYTPSAASHTGNFAILLQPAVQGGLARAALAGIVPVQIQLPSAPPSGVWNADVADGQTGYLAPVGGGAAQVLWIAAAETSYPATVWAVVRLGNVPMPQLCQIVPYSGSPATTDNLNAGGTCKVQVCPWTGYGYGAAAGPQLTATDSRGKYWGLCGEKILCQQHGWILEVCEPGAAYQEGYTQATLNPTDTVNVNVEPINGVFAVVEVTGLNQITTKALDSGSLIGMVYNIAYRYWQAVGCDQYSLL
jgi:hypothetical protein